MRVLRILRDGRMYGHSAFAQEDLAILHHQEASPESWCTMKISGRVCSIDPLVISLRLDGRTPGPRSASTHGCVGMMARDHCEATTWCRRSDSTARGHVSG